jgi:hypothetical protein
MGMVEDGDPRRNLDLMTDVMRDYLAARVEGISRSQTRPELISAAAPIHAHAAGLAEVMSRGDLVKFARERMSSEEARALGAQARTIVRRVEDYFVSLEKEKAEKAEKAAKREKRAA